MSSDRGHVQIMDGLRGLAITGVVAFHYWQLSFWAIPLGGGHSLEFMQFAGFLGVELFFFISAFCLFYPHANGRVPTLKHFYYRRAIKILPSYFLALLVFGFLITDLYPTTWEHGKFADLGLHLLFLHNLTAATHGSFDGVMWSLAVEVQFYLVFPLLAWLFRRRPFITATLMIAVSVAYRAWDRGRAGGDLGIWADELPAFLDLFAFGMLAAWLMVWIRQRPAAVEKLRAPLTAAAAISVVILLLFFEWVYAVRVEHPSNIWQSANRVYIGALFMVLAVASAFGLAWWRALLANRVLVFLSAISYNLYLWHQPIGRLIRDHGWWPANTPVPTDDPRWRVTYTFIAITASLLVASLITYRFERPLLRDGVRVSWLRLTRRMPKAEPEPAAATPEPVRETA